MSFTSKTVPDLSSNVLKLSFMRPSLKAAEKSKVKEDKNKLNITFDLPEDVLKLINDSMKNVNHNRRPKNEQSLFALNRLPRGARLSYGGFNLETERQMANKEINVDNYDEDSDPADECTITVEEMKEFADKNRKKFASKRQSNNGVVIELGGVVYRSIADINSVRGADGNTKRQRHQ